MVSGFCYPISSAAAADYSYKIDPVLAEKLEDMDDDDTIVVSIWFNDIDYNTIYEKSKAKLSEIYSSTSDKTSIDLLNLTMSEVSSESKKAYTVNMINRAIDDTSYSEKDYIHNIDNHPQSAVISDKVISTMRETSSKIITENNKKYIEEIFGKAIDINLNNNYNDDRIIFVSNYAPTLDILLKKQEIFSAIKNKNVSAVYL